MNLNPKEIGELLKATTENWRLTLLEAYKDILVFCENCNDVTEVKQELQRRIKELEEKKSE